MTREDRGPAQGHRRVRSAQMNPMDSWRIDQGS
jgi:hypothetical protein